MTLVKKIKILGKLHGGMSTAAVFHKYHPKKWRKYMWTCS